MRLLTSLYSKFSIKLSSSLSTMHAGLTATPFKLCGPSSLLLCWSGPLRLSGLGSNV